MTRLATYATVSTHLSLLSDRLLGEAIAAAAPLGTGIGGRSAELTIEGTRVFVKRIPLTDLELRPENTRSTANIFALPTFYHYGVGSSGFGAWRELAVHTMTTNWVLGNDYDGFPMTYHWRVLPDTPPEGFADEFGGVDAAVAHWDGSSAVRKRLEAIGSSSYSLVLFLEHVPHTLGEWLDDDRDYPWVDEALTRGTTFMSSRGLVHFDAHFANILTDGHRLYFADFGLALSSNFELSPDESDFLSNHLAYDRCYTASHLLHHILDGADHDVGRRPTGIPPETRAIIDRHARPTTILNAFHHRLLTQTKSTPFPTADLESAAGLNTK